MTFRNLTDITGINNTKLCHLAFSHKKKGSTIALPFF